MKKKQTKAAGRAATARRRARLALGSPRPAMTETPKPLRPPKHKKQRAEEENG